MNKETLVAAVAAKTRFSKKQTEETIEAAIAAIAAALTKGDRVTLVGFGTFVVKERAAREGRNPRTGAVLTIAARKAPAFIAGKALREVIASSKGRKAAAKKR
ncbi:MAG: HU family DNA-binding protein [Candidatus Sericytochromatia bacterium]|nr:HU family DNA-binding protein [Candidatus Sericytochromatia bacterium]